MHRILQRRRVRQLRVVWASLALVALSLAACSALFTAWTWRQTRDLSQSFKILQDRLEQVNTQRKAIVQLILEKRELLVGQRVKRDARPQPHGRKRYLPKHIKRCSEEKKERPGSQQDSVFTKVSSQQGWEERTLNMSKAVTYNREQGTFTVEKAGVYFLFCQSCKPSSASPVLIASVSIVQLPSLGCKSSTKRAQRFNIASYRGVCQGRSQKREPGSVLFNEQQSQYVKLDLVTRGARPQKLQCVEGYGTTPSAGPHPFHFLKPCQVSGLLRLEKGTQLQAVTGSAFRLHTVGNPSASPHIFSIFKIN
ncbi:unnamed protein product [Tetraodon nigroviridis]|uniref:(spotted green pufferfish) hypothetical protein n=1 Tax=Tetraodon nigroviridis TaxID=99883 RepID=Q4S449_TETNG|nr:unnamed protein product [Tetraodon nigroviridis]